MGKSLGVVVLAAVGGVIAGLLLAPKSGKDTRQDIAEKANEFKDKAARGVDEFKGSAASIKQEVAEGAQSIKREVTHRSDAIKDESEKGAENVRRATR